MSTAASFIAGGVSRTVPRLSSVVAEEFRVTPSRLVQGRPILMGLITIAVVMYLIRNSALLPLWLGMTFPMYAWQDRGMGRSSHWERPVPRRANNLVRHLTALSWTLGVTAVVALVSRLTGDPDQPAIAGVARTAIMFGGGILIFTIVSIVGQLMNPRRRYLLPMAMMALIPLIVLPSRLVLGILPDFLHAILIGPYGLDVFSGKWFASPSTMSWRLSDWYIAAALWIPGCLAALTAVAFIHHE